MPLLQASRLTKDYGHGKGAFEVDLQLDPGEIVGFIGPNGAGKSTTLSMLSGFIKPTSGSFTLFDAPTDHLNIHRLYPRLGILPSEVAFEPGLTPRRIFREAQLLLGRDLKNNWEKMADELELDLDREFTKLSLGNRKKVGFINCLMHEPELVILDEPTSGLDPLIQHKTMKLLQKVAHRGRAVLLSSHVLSEVQAFCDRIVMIKQGRIILESTTIQILDQAQRLFRFHDLPHDLLEELKRTGAVSKIQKTGNETLLYTPEYEKIIEILNRRKYLDFFLERPSLEETFMELYK